MSAYTHRVWVHRQQVSTTILFLGKTLTKCSCAPGSNLGSWNPMDLEADTVAIEPPCHHVDSTSLWTGRSRKVGGMSMLLAMPPIIRKERINKQRVEIMKKAIKRVNSMRQREVENQVLQVRSYCDQRRYIHSTLQCPTNGLGSGVINSSLARLLVPNCHPPPPPPSPTL